MLDPEALAGRVILLACDDMFTGEYVRECLLAAGADVLGPVRGLSQTSGLKEDGKTPDCALVSPSLGGQETGQMVACLLECGVPVVLTLRHNQYLSEALRGLPRLVAPFGGFQAVEAVQAVLSFAAEPAELDAGSIQAEAVRTRAD